MKKILLFLLLVFPIVAKAQLELPFPIKLVNSAPIDFWYFESDGTPYDNTGEVISQVLSAIRYRGMTFNVNGVEYWFGAGIADVDLVIKSTAMGYPGAGIPISTGSAWTTSITDNSADWNDALRIGATQTNTTAKTFNNATLLMRNVADTYSSYFINTNTAARTYTLPDYTGEVAVFGGSVNLNTFSNTSWRPVNVISLDIGRPVSGQNFGAINIIGGRGTSAMLIGSQNTPGGGNFSAIDLTNSTLTFRAGSGAVSNTTTATSSIVIGIGGIVINTVTGLDATGDIYYRASGGNFTRLAAGTNGHVLTLASGIPSWAAPSGGGGLTVGTSTITSGTNTKVLYNNSGVLGEYTVSGSGNVAMTTSPVFTTPNIGTATGSITGNAATVTTNANLTGAVTSSGNASSLGSFTSNALGTAVSDPARTVTGTDAIVQADNGRTIYFNSATPFNFTIDDLTINSQVMFINIGSADVDLVNGSGVTMEDPTGASISPFTVAAGSSAAITYFTTTEPIVLSGGSVSSGLTYSQTKAIAMKIR